MRTSMETLAPASARHRDAAKVAIALVAALSTILFVDRSSPLRHEVGQANGSDSRAVSRSEDQIARAFGQLPLSFEPNVGQIDPRVKFMSHGAGYTLFLTPDRAVLALRALSNAPAGLRGPGGMVAEAPARTDVLSMGLVGADQRASVVGVDPLPGISNYFIGNDPSAWHTGIPNFAKVSYRDIYPGVDLTYYGNQGGQLEYDFIVAAGVDPSVVRLG